MVQVSLRRAIAVVAGLVVVLLPLVGQPVATAATVSVTVDGGQKLQTISGLGADINPNSWDNGNLKPALDLLIDQEGMKTFRVGMDMLDWESRNDNSDPGTFNWDYYDPIYSGQTSYDAQYAGSNFADTWNVIDYLHKKGIPDSGIVLSFMGPGPAWMGGSSLASGQADEFVEEVLSAAYYGYSHGHTFGLFSPNNEMDISYNEGVTMSDTQYADILNRLAGRMDALGMDRVKILGPESCCHVGYADSMKAYPTLMANLAHFDFHNYNGDNNGAAGAVSGTGKDFWISEYADWDQTFSYLDQGAAGLQMWEAYDSVYNHAVVNDRGSDPGNDSLTFGDTPLIAYNKTTGVYTPRSEFYYFGQLFKWVPIGAQRISADSGNSDVKVEAFWDSATSRLTLVGQNTSGSAQEVSIALNSVTSPTAFQYYQTNSTSHMARGADVPVSANSATVTVPPDTTFTLTGTGMSDSVAPTAPSHLSAAGDVDSASLTWSASNDNVGVTRYHVYRSTTSGFTPSDTTEVGQSSTTSFSDSGLTAGTYYYLVTAEDAAGNISAPSNEASATRTADISAPAVSLTAPTDGGVVSGNVIVSASAFDNVGVAGVQFKLDGTNLGSEIVTTPYTTSWDASKTSPGSHHLTAVARDAAGNTTTSSAVTVTVTSAVTGPQLLGLDSIQGLPDNNAAGEAEAFRVTATADGRAGALTLYVDSGSAASALQAGIYSDASDDPGTLLASGSLNVPRPDAWNTVTLDSSPTLESGTAYWIAVLGIGDHIDYRDTPTGFCSQSNATTGLLDLPTTWSPGTSWPTCNLSAYVSATAPDPSVPTASPTTPKAPIKLMTPPTISGKVQVGEVVTVSDGAWSSPPDHVTYTWNVIGAPAGSSRTLKITPAMVGQRITATVHVSKESADVEGSAEAGTSPTPPVARGVLAVTARPTITGTYRVGKTLTATRGTVSPTATRGYHWYIKTGTRWVSRGTGRTFKLTNAYRTHRVQLRITYSANGYQPTTMTVTGSKVH